MITRIRTAGVIGIASLALVGSACSSQSSGANGDGGELTKVTVATGATTSVADLIVAVRQGFLKDEGLDVDLKLFADSNEALDLLALGQADVGMSTEPGAVIRVSKGSDIVAAAETATSGSANRFVGYTNKIHSPQDLEGLSIGYTVGSGGNYFFRNYVEKYGLDASKIHQVQAAPPDLMAALNRGDIQGMFTWDPWTLEAADTIDGVDIIADSGVDDVYNATNYLYFSRKAYENPKISQAVIRAMDATDAWMADNPDKAAQIVAKELKQPLDKATTGLKAWKWGPLTFSSDTETKQRGAAAMLLGAKLITKEPGWSSYLDSSALKAVDSSRVSK